MEWIRSVDQKCMRTMVTSSHTLRRIKNASLFMLDSVFRVDFEELWMKPGNDG